MFDPKKFTTAQPKPIPVVLLLDVSGSMGDDGKIESMNEAVREMIEAFSEEEKMETEILVSIITFGGGVNLHLPYTKASEVRWVDMHASGMTPMGGALKMAKAMIEDKDTTPSRAYRPTIVLVSDGEPNDNWEKPLQDFISDGRSSKCFCMSMAIGRGADEDVLAKFIARTPFLAKEIPNRVFHAENARQLNEFFQKVTMSVTMRSISKNPNDIPDPSEVKLDGPSLKPDTIDPSTSQADDDGYW